jgi:hypothetical protein
MARFYLVAILEKIITQWETFPNRLSAKFGTGKNIKSSEKVFEKTAINWMAAITAPAATCSGCKNMVFFSAERRFGKYDPVKDRL